MEVKTAKVVIVIVLDSAQLAVKEVLFRKPFRVDLFGLVLVVFALGSILQTSLWYRHSHESWHLVLLVSRASAKCTFQI